LTSQLTQFAQVPTGPLLTTWAVAERIAVPEPGTSLLLAIGVLAIAAARRDRKPRLAMEL
jgi:hypothetical protein